MEDTRAKNRKMIIQGTMVAWAVVVVIVIVVAIVANATRGDGFGLTVKCAPYTAAVFVDDVRVSNNAQISLEKGEHDVMCFRAGFEIYEEKVDMKEGDNILIGLASVTEAGKNEMKQRIKDYYDLESFAGKAEEKSIAMVFSEEEKKVAKFLPIINSGYGIGVLKEEDDFWVTITVKEIGYTDIAVNRLLAEARESGVLISNYKVRINDFVNVLEQYLNESVASADLIDYVNKIYAGVDTEIRGSGTVGDYGYAIVSALQPSGERVTYRVVLKNEGATWKIVNAPQPILTVYNTLDVPQDVLDTINNKKAELTGNT